MYDRAKYQRLWVWIRQGRYFRWIARTNVLTSSMQSTSKSFIQTELLWDFTTQSVRLNFTLIEALCKKAALGTPPAFVHMFAPSNILPKAFTQAFHSMDTHAIHSSIWNEQIAEVSGSNSEGSQEITKREKLYSYSLKRNILSNNFNLLLHFSPAQIYYLKTNSKAIFAQGGSRDL